MLGSISSLSPRQLNEIPPGFNNNIIWNLAYLIACQQGVCYFCGGLPLRIKRRIFSCLQARHQTRGHGNGTTN